jgi:hypothetical protein
LKSSSVSAVVIGAVVSPVGCSKLPWCFLCCWLCKRDSRHKKHHNPRLTAPYVVPLDEFDSEELTDEQLANGWQIVANPVRGANARATIKVWPSDGYCRGSYHRKGEKMRTWEVIDERDLSTYSMLGNPAYSGIVAAMLDDAPRTARTGAIPHQELHRAAVDLHPHRPEVRTDRGIGTGVGLVLRETSEERRLSDAAAGCTHIQQLDRASDWACVIARANDRHTVQPEEV